MSELLNTLGHLDVPDDAPEVDPPDEGDVSQDPVLDLDPEYQDDDEDFVE